MEIRTVCLFRLRHVELAKSEIAQGNVACVVEENVLWFQITAPGGEKRRNRHLSRDTAHR